MRKKRKKQEERKSDRNSPLKKIKKQILKEPNPELPYYVKPPYPILKKKLNNEKEDGHLNLSMENVNKHEVIAPCGKVVEKTLVYAQLFKSLLIGKRKPKYDENIDLT